MLYKATYFSPVGKITLASDGDNIIGLWLEGQKYYGGTLTEKCITRENMKRIKYIVIVTVMLVIFTTLNVFASPYNLGQYTSVNEVSTLLPPGVKQSKATESAKPRGVALL